MAKGIRLGVGGVKASKKVWVGVGSAARKVKKIFGGVGGIVKLFFSGGISTTSAPALTSAKGNHAGIGTANHAIFVGGIDGNNARVKTGDAYNTSMVRSSVTLWLARQSLAASKVGEYAVFAGGITGDVYSSETAVADVDCFNASLVRYTRTLGDARYNLVGGYSSTHALFAYGASASGIYAKSLYALDTSLVRTNPSASMTAQNTNLASGGNCGTHAIYVGVTPYSSGKTHEGFTALSSSLVSSFQTLPVGMMRGGIANLPTHAIAVSQSGNALAINHSLVITQIASLNRDRRINDNWRYGGDPAVGSVGNNVIVLGGNDASAPSPFISEIEIYDESLIKQVSDVEFTPPRWGSAIASVGGKCFVAGGFLDSFSTKSATVNVFEI